VSQHRVLRLSSLLRECRRLQTEKKNEATDPKSVAD
jgi:hypothetical protein